MSDPTLTVEAIVSRAQSLESGDRIAYLRSACGPDDALFARALESLHTAETSGWWDTSEAESLQNDPAESLVGTVIGKYRVTGVLGSGGMGRVLLAERADEQFTHKVAIKLVRGDLVSKQVQTRLRIERQILATLDHPNIAKLLDGGTHAGMPYIVMEYVDGQPIDNYCNERRLSIRERLELFRKVCSAVHYAHQNLIVHRDLKPSNILVTAEGAPKLLDFGIAKPLDTRRFSQTIAVTHFDSRMLTPDHASPEQVRGEPLTTASDTYVLGVLLYELVTGRKPLLVRTERLSELEQAICEQPPAPLALGLNGEARLPDDFLAEICDQRSASPAKLRRELGGDLEAIAAMALRKEPERRYSSVEQFSNDIGRYLEGLPIIARRDTWSYRARKFVTRHTAAVAMSTLAIASLGAFSVVTAVQSRRIAIERSNAEEVSAFLVGMFEQADPDHARGNDITVKEMLDAASKRMTQELHEHPTTKSRLLSTLGTVYGKLGNYADAERALRDALSLREASNASEPMHIADLQHRLADVLIDSGKLDEAEGLLESALIARRDRLGGMSKEAAQTLHSFARLRRHQGRLPESAELHAQCVRILEQAKPLDAASLVSALNDWAVLLDYRKDYRAAERTFAKARELGEQHLDHDHPLVAQSLLGLASALVGLGEFDKAQPLYEQSVATYERIYGNEHPQTAQVWANYGIFLRRAGRLEDAERALRKAVTMQAMISGEGNVRTAYARVSLGLVLLDSRRFDAAKDELGKALTVFSRELPADHQYVGSALLGLGRAQLGMGEPREAAESLRRAADIARREYSPNSIAVASITAAQGGSLLDQGRDQEAEALLTGAYPILLSVRGPNDLYTLQVREWITTLYEKQGRQDKARDYFTSLAAK